MVDNIEQVALRYACLYRYGRAELVEQTVIDPTVVTEFQRLVRGEKGVIILVPHCAAAVLSSAGLNTFHPTVLLVREPRAPARCELMLEYVRKLGPEFILTRNTPPSTVTRNIVRALREHKAVVGTVDLAGAEPDSIETRIFGQQIHSPGWPARLSARLGAPLLPSYIHIDGNQIRLLADEGYVEPNIQLSTQRWVTSFERRFGQYPSDWVFMLDKSWARVLAAASESAAFNLQPPVLQIQG
jgi:lauroyl/myristoyl acyltransferase